jgi:hypothetical protein
MFLHLKSNTSNSKFFKMFTLYINKLNIYSRMYYELNFNIIINLHLIIHIIIKENYLNMNFVNLLNPSKYLI